MRNTHNTLANRATDTPFWFTLAARFLTTSLLAQFLSAGAGLFRDGGWWAVHAIIGGILGIYALVLVCAAFTIRRLNGFRWWTGLTFGLYLTQAALAAGAKPLQLSFHPFNGALLLTASLILLAKVECRRRRSLSNLTAY